MILVMVERCPVIFHHIEDPLEELQDDILSVKWQRGKEPTYTLIHYLQVHLKLVWFAILKNTLRIQAQWFLQNLTKSALSSTKLKF